jgi:hypothetical protein
MSVNYYKSLPAIQRQRIDDQINAALVRIDIKNGWPKGTSKSIIIRKTK